MAQRTIYLSDEMWRRLKHDAIDAGLSVSAYIEQRLESSYIHIEPRQDEPGSPTPVRRTPKPKSGGGLTAVAEPEQVAPGIAVQGYQIGDFSKYSPAEMRQLEKEAEALIHRKAR